MEKARQKAKQYSVPNSYPVQELMDDPEIELILNLTIPKEHANVSLAAIEAGKHVYVEKPLAVSLEDGKQIIENAFSKGVMVGGAPDTFLGGGIQTSQKLVEDGWIGSPISANAFFMSRGVEHWHPNPDFYYQPGGGPMFDMGPYYLTALISLIGSISKVTGFTSTSFPYRVALDKRKIPVEVPTHVAGLLNFENGAIGTLITSFDSHGHNLPQIEIYGEKGTLSVPDPNHFGGKVLYRKQNNQTFQEVPLLYENTQNSRGIGLADMTEALLENREPRANGSLLIHVLETMHGFHISAEQEKNYNISSSAHRPKLLPIGKTF